MTVALLPATKAIFGKNKATVAEVADTWRNSTIQVMLNNKGKMRFVVGYGIEPGNNYDKYFYAHHDQTGAGLGLFQEINRILVDKDGKIVSDPGNFQGHSAAVLVYK